ncbi:MULTISPECIES: MBL fold metallo-hydrolase [unclassified Luteococcus]|uniref:MBL fold metallo-hydrolase n=1 Tax=unclassified Luteococcus TaxID=2639923 RepID=UPI00313B55E0
MSNQATPPATIPFGAEAFESIGHTELRWLTMAGFLVNSRGTTLMIDPLLRDFDMPMLTTFPITTAEVPRLDAVLVTHSDNDHFSRPTCRDLAALGSSFHTTQYVADEMRGEELEQLGGSVHGHDIEDSFTVNDLRVRVLPADHAWQNAKPKPGQRTFQPEDCCGFWIDTPDGSIWAPGDSRLIREHHLAGPSPDVMLFDFSDSEWHFTLDGAIEMANAHPTSQLLLHHWGCVDAPDFSPFNGNPADLMDRVVNPERIRVLAPGEAFRLPLA